MPSQRGGEVENLRIFKSCEQYRDSLMTEKTYRTSKARILRQSIFIWVALLTLILANIFAIESFNKLHNFWVIVLPNILLGLLTIPGIIIYFNYLKFSKHKEINISGESVELIDTKTGFRKEFKTKDINSVRVYSNDSSGKLPWTGFQYLCFINASNQRIIVTSFLMDLDDFNFNNAPIKIDPAKFQRLSTYYPIIKI